MGVTDRTITAIVITASHSIYSTTLKPLLPIRPCGGGVWVCVCVRLSGIVSLMFLLRLFNCVWIVIHAWRDCGLLGHASSTPVVAMLFLSSIFPFSFSATLFVAAFAPESKVTDWAMGRMLHIRMILGWMEGSYQRSTWREEKVLSAASRVKSLKPHCVSLIPLTQKNHTRKWKPYIRKVRNMDRYGNRYTVVIEHIRHIFYNYPVSSWGLPELWRLSPGELWNHRKLPYCPKHTETFSWSECTYNV